MKKIRVGAVAYLNTKPLLYGIKSDKALMNQIELTEDYPARLAEKLENDQLDIGLVPVAVIPHLSKSYIVGDYCIGADKPVASVCLFSDVSIEKINTVLLDYQSRTSVNLAKILFKYYWKKEVAFVEGNEHFRNEIKGDVAGVVIGDRAFEQMASSQYKYDLAEAWIDFTGLPFVFACWVSNKKPDDAFIKAFNRANEKGLLHLDEVVAEQPQTGFDLKHYYTENISYFLDDNKKKGLEKFLHYLKDI